MDDNAAIPGAPFVRPILGRGKHFDFDAGDFVQSYARGVSADGSVVVGNVHVTDDCASFAFRWSAGVSEHIGSLGGRFCRAYALSADSSVIVGSSLDPWGDWRAFRCEHGRMADLGSLGGGSSCAMGVSGDGLVAVGQSMVSCNGAAHAFHWFGGYMLDLGTFGGSNSAAMAVSADGLSVVGWANTVGDTASHAFLWAGENLIDLGTLGGTDSYANAVSGDGSAAVGQSRVADNGPYHAFLWSGGSMVDLGTLGGSASIAYGVSGDGSVVVGKSQIAGDTVWKAFRWTKEGGMQTLAQWLSSVGGACEDWSLTEARATNHDGSVVVGHGWLNGAGDQAFVARGESAARSECAAEPPICRRSRNVVVDDAFPFG